MSKLKSIIQDDLDNGIESDSTAVGPESGSKKTFKVAWSTLLWRSHHLQIAKLMINVPTYAAQAFVQTQIFFHPRLR